MSALLRKATELLRGREMTRRANKRHNARSINYLCGISGCKLRTGEARSRPVEVEYPSLGLLLAGSRAKLRTCPGPPARALPRRAEPSHCRRASTSPRHGPPTSGVAALCGKIAQAHPGRRTPFGRILELGQSGQDPTAAVRFDGGQWQSVVAQPDECAIAVRLEQELHGRLPGLEPFHATPSEYDLSIRNDLEIGSLDGDAGRTRDTEQAARPGIGLHQLGEPDLHMGRIGQQPEYRFGQRINANLQSDVARAFVVAHLGIFLRSAASAASFSRLRRGRQNPAMNSASSSKP